MKLSEEILTRFRDGLARAEAAGLPEPNAMSLATADAEGRPGVRTVLLKAADADGFVFYTNIESRKGRALAANPAVSLLFWWRELQEQILIDGTAGRVTDAEADAYFASRPRDSQLGAWASDQSRPLADRDTLLEKFQELQREYDGREIPRPPYWTGFRVRPERVEFWYGRDHRLHERICYRPGPDGWQRTLLYP